MRGPPIVQPAGAGGCGITPACAGTTIMWFTKNVSDKDHPRLCGDHRASALILSCHPGSPPPVRGPLQQVLLIAFILRITPACAGTTRLDALRLHLKWDHPRLCGDHHRKRKLVDPLQGSPPPVRGPHNLSLVGGEQVGIPPACAGPTPS